MKPSAVLCWIFSGLVAAQSTTSDAPPAWITGVVTDDGTCGKAAGTVCSPEWGACCGKDNTCGRSSQFCGDDCQSSFGNCNAAAPATTPVPGSVSPDGSCGGTNQYKCVGSTFGDCCSSNNFCGNTTSHCNAGCQKAFGTCSTGSDSISVDGQCGSNGKTCAGSSYGDCCSSSGYCGEDSDHCDAGCQASFGTCSSTGSTDISVDGHCGTNGKTCKGSKYGDCCSSSGYCGTGDDFCSAGCQPSFGSCSGTGSGDISTNGQCGSNGKTCKGSTYGDCCSSSGYCGTGSDFCTAGCQASFGTCSTGSDKISTDGQCGSNGKTCTGSTYGDCCSSTGYCGTGTDFCDGGCQTLFGTCSAGSSKISTDGACGSNGKTCTGSKFGGCCSSSGYCGSSIAFCGGGCQSGFGTCEFPTVSSIDGTCGPKNGKICLGSGFGNCCSMYGSCGSTKDHCGQGCQKGYGSCS